MLGAAQLEAEGAEDDEDPTPAEDACGRVLPCRIAKPGSWSRSRPAFARQDTLVESRRCQFLRATSGTNRTTLRRARCAGEGALAADNLKPRSEGTHQT